jgi:ABC-type multidrug transport system ATPase subunit
LPSTNPTDPVIVLQRVSKLYGSFVALRDVSLTLPAGSSAVLLGPNGAGKSTLLKLLAGLERPSYGELRVFGDAPLHARGRIAYMGHSSMLYDELTGSENLAYALGLHEPALSSSQRNERVATALEEVGLDPGNRRRVGEFSQGMRQRAALARVLLTDPDLLLLDEPFSNLDTASVAAMVSRLQMFCSPSRRNTIPRTLILTTHQAEVARPLAHQSLLLRNGQLISAEDAEPYPGKNIFSASPISAT